MKITIPSLMKIGNPNTNYDNPALVNVTTNLNGNYTGTIIPQGNGFLVGSANLPAFNGVFTGSLNVLTAGAYTIRTYHDVGEDVLEAALEIYGDYPEVMAWLETAWEFGI